MTTPYPYQTAGIRFLSSRPGAILGDAVGLGKTYEAVWAVMETTVTSILVICPSVIKAQWEDVITTLVAESGTRCTLTEELLPKTPIIKEFFDGDTSHPPDRVWVLAHYEQFIDKSSARKVLNRGWGTVIIDEVHKIAGRTAQRTKNICALRSRYRWGLSGTPMRDRPQDLWQPLNWIASERWSSYWAFVKKYTNARPGQWGGMEIKGTRNLDTLDAETRRYLLMRRPEDVGQELPPLTVKPVHLSLTTEQEVLYNTLKKEVLVALTQELKEEQEEGIWDFTAGPPKQIVIKNAISRFTRLHQCASAPGATPFLAGVEGAKEEWLRDYVEGGGEPAVILTRYNASAAAIRRLLKELGVADQYTVGTWDKLSHGLNLQHYCVLIAWDTTFKRLDWVQGIGRIERTGQTRPMTVFQLLLKDSVDLDVKDMIDNKATDVEMVEKWLRREFA